MISVFLETIVLMVVSVFVAGACFYDLGKSLLGGKNAESPGVLRSEGRYRGRDSVLVERDNPAALVAACRERLRTDLDEFRAYQECPKCGTFDYHWLKEKENLFPEWAYLGHWHPTGEYTVVRQCKSCNHEWKQK